jgi:phytoene dehydrogenase-like protein
MSQIESISADRANPIQAGQDPVVVVGGGIAGLLCATTLAKSGRAVLLLDAGARLGGRADTTDHEGYLLNEGAHALYASSARLLAAAGVKATGKRPKLEKARVLRGGELLPAPFTPGKLAARGPLSVRERAQYVKALAAAVTARPGRLSSLSCQSWVDEHSSTPLLSDLLGGLVRLSSYCGQLADAPAEAGVALLGEASRQPVRYVDGGWQTIVSGLAESALENGAQLRSGAKVEALLAEDRVVGVRLADGEEIPARSVVLAGLPPTRAERLLGAAGGQLPRPLAEPRPVHAACLDVALSELPRPDCPFVLGLDEPLYLSVHSLSSRLTPGSGAVVQLLRYDDGAEITAQAAQTRLEELLDQAQPGWRERVVHRRFAPRMIADCHLPTPVEGLASRPAVDATGLDGAFIAGDWVGPHGWLAGTSLHSGLAAAQAVMRQAADSRAGIHVGASAGR